MTYAGITDWNEALEAGDNTTAEGLSFAALAEVAGGDAVTAADTPDAASKLAEAYRTTELTEMQTLETLADQYTSGVPVFGGSGGGSSGGGSSGGSQSGDLGGTGISPALLVAVVVGGLIAVAVASR
jgi:uncharacterized membrane protein YgcG